jgi:peptidoglycan/xylan/chitin deacetylase (PgdA/CDA1 family)
MKNEQKRIVVVFRNDDPSATADLEHEREIFACFEKAGIPQTLGVIPKVCTGAPRDPHGQGEFMLSERPEVISFLAEYVRRTGSEIALHGLTHRTNKRSLPARKHFSEFIGLPLDEQERMLLQGIQILQDAFGAKPTTFIPPWNELDMNTVVACARTGLRVVSAGVHVQPVKGVILFGVNTDLAGFHDVFRQAREGHGITFLHVLFHSKTVKSAEEKSLLTTVLQTVTNDPDCEAITLAEAVRRYPDQIGVLNDAGKNLAQFGDLLGSNRAKSTMYLNTLCILKRISGLDRLLSEARSRYFHGDYSGCLDLSEDIDKVSTCLLWAMRITTLGANFGLAILGVFAFQLLHAKTLFLWLLPVLLIALFVKLSRNVIAVDTRRELLFACFLAVTGNILGLVFGGFLCG